MNSSDASRLTALARGGKLLLLAAVAYIAWPYVSDVILLLLLAFLLTTLLLPAVDKLESRLHRRGAAVFVLVGGLLTAIIVFVTRFITGISNEAAMIASDVTSEDVVAFLGTAREWTLARLPEFTRPVAAESWQAMDPERITDSAVTLLASLAKLTAAAGGMFFSGILLVIITSILLYDYRVIRKSIVRLVPNRHLESALRLIAGVEGQTSRYLRGQLTAAATVGLLSMGGLLLLNLFAGANISLVVFLGAVAGLANLIPLAGPILAMAPAIILAVVNNLDNPAALHHHLFGLLPIPSPFFSLDIALVFLLVQQIDNHFVTPRVIGRSVGMHPLAIILALLVGAEAMGPVGMLLAVPVAGTIKVIGAEVMRTRGPVTV